MKNKVYAVVSLSCLETVVSFGALCVFLLIDVNRGRDAGLTEVFVTAVANDLAPLQALDQGQKLGQGIGAVDAGQRHGPVTHTTGDCKLGP